MEIKQRNMLIVQRRVAGETYDAIARSFGMLVCNTRVVCMLAMKHGTVTAEQIRYSKERSARQTIPDEEYNARWLARLAAKSRPGENGCIELPDVFHNADGYANLSHRSLGVFAHRIVTILKKGPIPPDKMACHRCGNHGCVNDDHLYVGTMKQNAADTVAMGRHRESQKTHCPKNHPLSGDNIVWVGPRKNKRQCLACQRERHAKVWGQLTPEQKARIYIRRNIYRRAKAAQRRAEAQA